MHAYLLDALLPQLAHPNVRDLAWALLSPPLVDDPLQRHPLAGSEWACDPEALAAWLRKQEAAPGELEQWLARFPTRRLGLYYERLWQFALGRAPGVRLIAANLPVREDGRTLGELDLLIEDGEGLHHLELAVKFYLGPVTMASEGGVWVGPGAEDRLDVKLARLQGPQLSLAGSDQARALLAPLGIEKPRSRFWLAGYLFHPPGHAIAPACSMATHLSGTWLRPAHWLAHLHGPSTVRWEPLERRRWLAPARSEIAWETDKLRSWLQERAIDRSPQLMAALQQAPDGHWEEQARAFWVGDDWPGSC